MGLVEAHGGLASRMLERVITETPPQTQKQWEECLDIVCETKSQLRRVRGSSPGQVVFGRDRQVPEDLLSDEAIEHLEDSMQRVRQAIVQPESPTSLEEALNHLEKTANKWLKPYPNASIRENIEVFLVAAAVVLAFRSFFFQPMAIPTGSAQPAFWGITHEDLRGQPESAIPGGLKKYYFSWIKGEKYYHLKAKTSGTLRLLDPKPVRVIPLVTKQRLQIGNQRHTIWFPPENLWDRASLRSGMTFKQGEDVIRLKVTSGDHLFVDRLTYNFRRPTRGETIVFNPRVYQN